MEKLFNLNLGCNSVFYNLFQIAPPETATTDPTTSPGPSTSSSGASKRSAASTSSAQPKKKKVKTENPSIKIKQDPDQVQGQDQDEQDQKPAAGKSYIFCLSGNIEEMGIKLSKPLRKPFFFNQENVYPEL